MKIRNTLITVLSVILITVTVFSFAGCNKRGMLYSEKNAYVSVYIYTNPAENAKPKMSLDRLRVAPEDEVAAPETNEDNLLTDEAARQLYRTKPTGLYALELTIAEKDKKQPAPTVIVSQYEGTVEYTLDTVLGVSAGKSATSNDMYEWRFYINGKEADPVKDEIHTYDLLEFKLKEQTYRTFTATFKAMNGAKPLFEDKKFSYVGEKSEMTIAHFLQGEYTDYEKKFIDIDKELGLTLSEDGRRVVKIGTVAADETHKWICLIDEDEIEGDLSNTMIDERHEIMFEYVEIKVEADTGEVTEAPAEEPAE